MKLPPIVNRPGDEHEDFEIAADEIAADRILLELAEVEPDDEARVAAILEECLEHLRAAPPTAMFGEFTRDDAIFVLEHGRDFGPLTAAQLRDSIRRYKGELAQ